MKKINNERELKESSIISDTYRHNFYTEGSLRNEYLASLETVVGVDHMARRNEIYCDVLKLYEKEKILKENPLSNSFQDEGVDECGVTWEMFSEFWEAASKELFEGA